MSASRIDQSERETNEKRDDVGVAAETRWMDGGGWLVGERKGPSVAAALSFRRRAALQETSASRIRPAETETDVVPWRCSHRD